MREAVVMTSIMDRNKWTQSLWTVRQGKQGFAQFAKICTRNVSVRFVGTPKTITLIILLFADELIRQVAINCPERGLLNLRVRDEIRMTIDAYKTLYESSVTFGCRKHLQAETGVSEMKDKIGSLEGSKKELENQVLELRNKVEVIEKRESERRALEEKKRQEENDFLKYQGQHLDTFLKSLGGGK